MKYFSLFPALISAGMLYSWPTVPLLAQSGLNAKVAFLADIHLQDVYGDFQSNDFQGIFNPKTGKYATIRTMESQLNSTRLFNENYFALREALEDLQQKGIKLVALPGDFTDDGQPMNVIALQKILDEYASTYGMRFFITTGNHDPVSPFGGPDSKADFLGENGQKQAIQSSQGIYPSGQSTPVSSQISNWGYYEICEKLKHFGFSPGLEDLFWTHPFQEWNYEGYSFDQALKTSAIQERIYLEKESGRMLPDASYLVEPVEGIWLLAIDGNVYSYSGEMDSVDSAAWRGSGTGFNLASKVKAHQLEWIKKVSQEAEKQGKVLISFSHYPLVDFHDGASDEMKQLFGAEKFQLSRVPDPEVSELYAEAGIRIHFAGHMHINDTGILQKGNSNELINIQIPSLAAFPPAYKIMNLKNHQSMEVETHVLNEVRGYDEFFDLYKMEHQWLTDHGSAKNWSPQILDSEDYLNFTKIHLQELIRLRFTPSDWPDELGILVNGISQSQLQDWVDSPGEKRNILVIQYLEAIRNSSQKGNLMEDFYLIKNGGDLGANLISESHLSLYQSLNSKNLKLTDDESSLNSQFSRFLWILEKLSNGLPSDDFFIDLQKMQIRELN